MYNLINENPTSSLNNAIGRAKFVCDWTHGVYGNILNIGSGHGWYELFLAKETNSNLICGVDLDVKVLAAAKEFDSYKNVTFKSGTALNLPYEDSLFDFVVCSEVIEHIPKKNEEIFFGEIYRVLRPGGTLFLTCPNYSFFANISDPAYFLLGHRHYKLKDLESFGLKSGLRVIDAVTFGGLFDLTYIWNLYIAKWIFRRPPFLSEYYKKKINQEFGKKGKWFMTNFLRYKKLSS